jgi:hypothetical protein
MQEFPWNLKASFAVVQVKIRIRRICLNSDLYFTIIILYDFCGLFYGAAASKPLFLNYFLTGEHPKLFATLEGAP